MSQGFAAYNNNGQVLVSSETRNLHFVQKLTSPAEVLFSSDNYGGTRRWRYRAACAVTPVPFFTMPTQDFYGVSRVSQVSPGQWDIEVIRSGTSAATPVLYIFADPRAVAASGNFGLLVYRDDGTASFDSRLSPLAVTGGVSVAQPSNPRSGYPYGLDPSYCQSSEAAAGGIFAPDQWNNFALSGQPATPMFFYPSLAQSEREAHYATSQNDCLGFSKIGICLTQTNYNWNSYYWCFYRGGIRYDGATINAGWIAVSFGCNWTYSQDGYFLGIGTGGGSGGGGAWPYTNETLNLTSSTVIVGDATRYD